MTPAITPATCPAPAATVPEEPALRAAAIVAAGGSGERFGNRGGKQLYELCGLPMVCWSLLALEATPAVECIVIVCPEDQQETFRELAVAPLPLTKPVLFASSGSTRQESCASGLAAVPDGIDVVAIHDGARPLVLPATIQSAIEAVACDDSVDGAVCGHPAIDTLKIVEGTTVVATPDRASYWVAQTPQVFRLGALRAAYARAGEDGFAGTDDAVVMEHAGGRVVMVESPRDNLKVTVPEDVAPVEAILEGRMMRAACGGDEL